MSPTRYSEPVTSTLTRRLFCLDITRSASTAPVMPGMAVVLHARGRTCAPHLTPSRMADPIRSPQPCARPFALLMHGSRQGGTVRQPGRHLAPGAATRTAPAISGGATAGPGAGGDWLPRSCSHTRPSEPCAHGGGTNCFSSFAGHQWRDGPLACELFNDMRKGASALIRALSTTLGSGSYATHKKTRYCSTTHSSTFDRWQGHIRSVLITAPANSLHDQQRLSRRHM